jgi:hypothetical protein
LTGFVGFFVGLFTVGFFVGLFTVGLFVGLFPAGAAVGAASAHVREPPWMKTAESNCASPASAMAIRSTFGPTRAAALACRGLVKPSNWMSNGAGVLVLNSLFTKRLQYPPALALYGLPQFTLLIATAVPFPSVAMLSA